VIIGILITPLGLLYSDVGRLIPISLQVLMYVTPVVYVIPTTGLMRDLMVINPLSYIITDLRNTLTGYEIENPLFWLGLLITSVLLGILALAVYRVSMPILTERMS
jgi:lipopolysaccharide transport system permease protein